ncbi:hypothetical protein ACTXPD_18990 [Vreelandella alkaliphila]|uniref:hypothetical protein n=1 Tax=Halomonadaceae TaxID=28256 RepID=UPI0018687F52|nr:MULTISPECIES: hypothetical protein [unclassified Halomonas]
MRKLSDLKPVFTSERVTEWQPAPQGPRYRYERDRAAVGQEMTPGSEQYEWYVLAKNDLTSAKRKVFELINQDYL